MKNTIIIISLILVTLSCKAQHVIPVENAVNYRDSIGGLMGDKDYVYVKDINNLLNKFVGTWKGTYNNKNYEFKVIKITEDDDELKADKLLMRYKITELDGTVIEDITSLPNDDTLVITGNYLAKTGSYVFFYQGKNSNCGQNGDIFLQPFTNTTVKLFLHVYGEIYNCPNGEVAQVLPTEQVTLTKQ